MEATLENLLCIIHRDGGQYIAKHGIQKAFEDAIEIHYNQREAKENMQQLKIETDRLGSIEGLGQYPEVTNIYKRLIQLSK